MEFLKHNFNFQSLRNTEVILLPSMWFKGLINYSKTLLNNHFLLFLPKKFFRYGIFLWYGVFQLWLLRKLGCEWCGWYENSLFCLFWLTVLSQKGQIWNSLDRILIFNSLEIQKLYYYQVCNLKDWLTIVKTSYITTFCYFWPKLSKKLVLSSFKYGISVLVFSFDSGISIPTTSCF